MTLPLGCTTGWPPRPFEPGKRTGPQVSPPSEDVLMESRESSHS
jgi:hypothetical protein